MKPPSFANLLEESGWTYYNYREENPCEPCDQCRHLTEYGWWNLSQNLWLCESCYAIESGEK